MVSTSRLKVRERNMVPSRDEATTARSPKETLTGPAAVARSQRSAARSSARHGGDHGGSRHARAPGEARTAGAPVT